MTKILYGKCKDQVIKIVFNELPQAYACGISCCSASQSTRYARTNFIRNLNGCGIAEVLQDIPQHPQALVDSLRQIEPAQKFLLPLV